MGSVLDYLNRAAETSPDRTAVSDGVERLTFHDLQRKVNALAWHLYDRGVTNRAVGLYAQRRTAVIVGMLACAASGNCYVPLNPQAPDSKNAKIIAHAHVSHILGFGADEYRGETEGAEYIAYDELDIPARDDAPSVPVSERDTLYIIYTSGSTGEPKGIRKSHGAVMNFVEAYVKALDFGRSEILGNQTPFCFDASAKDIYLMLKTGACLEIIPSDKFAFPVTLIEYLNEKKITFLSWVPSALAIVARLRTFRDILPETVRRVCFVGEVFPIKDLAAWREALPDIEYINLYGSSELAGICCMYPIPKDKPLPPALPIGKPLENTRIYLYENGRIVPDQGEMLVESGALADEYIQDSERTAQTFMDIEINGETRRVLRTGDWARYDEAGNLVFISRGDGQIKYKGYRIELGEIEAAVNALEHIGQACCLYNAEKERITVFCTTTREDLKLRDLNGELADKLVDYMLPRRLVVLDEMPLNANGKIDRPYLKTLL